MKALITGARGTVGSALARHLRGLGDQVVPWDRAEIPIDRYDAMESFVRRERPDVLFHLAVASTPTGRADEAWQVNYEWASELAWICRVLGVTLVFTSTVLVFSDRARGPFALDTAPDADSGYGREKRLAEARVVTQDPAARVVRLGWQIGDGPGGNNMLDFFERRVREDGAVRASRRWLPATSFLSDTCAALRRLAAQPPGLYHLNSNRRWSFYAIARALSRRHGDRWPIEACDDFIYDQRLLDDRLEVPSLDQRLPELAAEPDAATG